MPSTSFQDILSIKSSSSIFPAIKSGFSTDVLAALAKRLGISINQMVELLPVSRSTWNRFRARGVLDAKVSDRLVLFMNLLEDGERVLGSNFVKWLNKPLLYFNMRTPLSLLNTATGLNMISAELGRIEHGVFA